MVFGKPVYNIKQRLDALAKFKRYIDRKKKKEGRKNQKRKEEKGAIKVIKVKKGIKAIKVQVWPVYRTKQ